ncbi:GapA-binding peptide SR1P [Bacillus paranthracis]|nr:GapA-binding peptide SR1P [Bacillus paranthracis]MCC2518658.1 GapA-binding peptide SR1P [Bacillus paranthracis]
MGTIVCQVCEGTIGHFEDDEKSTVLYGKCGSHCDCDHKEHSKA